MSRHIIDNKRDGAPSKRTAAYVKIDREARPNPASKALHKSRPGERSGRVLKEFARIERGETA